jgi:hypothetical protein
LQDVRVGHQQDQTEGTSVARRGLSGGGKVAEHMYINITVSMTLTLVEFGIEVEEGVENGDGGWQVRKDESRDDIATKLKASDDK